mmetsp:Transcript_9604/g.14447  ORF Transcript_9604/g.14447 Transcript_9604/m.14447 type:complete len:221 (-) Transcript_9604:55-717(-)
MGSEKSVKVGIFMQEFFGSFLLLVLLFPFGSFLGDTWTGWIAHFFCVMLHDWTTNGAQVNPSVSFAVTVYGWNKPSIAVLRIVAQFLGGSIAFPLAHRLLPPYIQMGGPLLGNTSLTDGFIWEFGLTFTLLMIVYSAATQVGLPGQRPIIASGIRSLIYYGGKTGPAMNPMIAFSWAMYAAPESIDSNHFLVYWIAPTLGATVATYAWKSIEPKKVTKQA